MMSRKDYVALASAIRAERPLHDDAPIDRALDELCDAIAGRIAYYLAGDNPRFDGARFLAACEAQR